MGKNHFLGLDDLLSSADIPHTPPDCCVSSMHRKRTLIDVPNGHIKEKKKRKKIKGLKRPSN